MTPLKRWALRGIEKIAGRFYEGPIPPDRLAEIVLAFAEAHPHATRRDWMKFAAEHAAESYRSAYVRGVQYTERSPETWMPDVSPEEVADQLSPDWRWSPPVLLNLPLDQVVPEDYDDAALMLEDMRRVNE